MKTFEFTGIIGIEILPQQISEALKEADGEDITFNFVSVGGYVFEGFQIFNQIKEYTGKKTVILNGIVASIAAYISTAFDIVKAKDNSTFMIHNAMGGALGDYRVLEKEAKELKRLNNVIGKSYASKSGNTIYEILDLMEEESWFYGHEIIEAGFADELINTDTESERTQVLKMAQAKYNSLKLDPRSDDILKAAAMIKEEKPSDSVAVGNNKLGGTSMKKNEVFETLKVLKQNAEITLPEIAEALGLKNQLVTQTHIDALNLVNKLNDMNITDPINEIKTLKKQITNDAESVRAARLDSLFGVHNETEENELRFYMDNQTKNLIGEKLDEKINEMKESDPIMKRLMAERADQDSDVNNIGVSDEQRKIKNKKNEGTATVKRHRVDRL